MPEISLSMSQILTHSSCFTESEQEPTFSRGIRKCGYMVCKKLTPLVITQPDCPPLVVGMQEVHILHSYSSTIEGG